MKKISVLFLDDDENVLKSIRRMFADESYGVAVAQNSKDAMDIIAREKIKVVLSDQRMPDITGVEFLHRLKMQYPDIVRILFTAYANLMAAEQAINISEVFRFINKPWHQEELKAAVVNAMYHYDLVLENRLLFESTKVKNGELQSAHAKLKVLYDIQRDLSSTLSHELRTPLASIKAALDIVISETAGKTTPEQQNFLGKAKGNVDRLNRLINDILDLAHLEYGKVPLTMTCGDVNTVIQTVAESQEPVALSKGLFLKVLLDPAAPAMDFDQDKLAQVLNNLISNALKFTNTGGITVTSSSCPSEGTIKVTVKDTGCGIKPEDQGRLFEKFQQIGESHQQSGGTGLGLAICKEIVRQHSGRLGVESTPGEGSCFYFMLPVIQRSHSYGK